jgi:hypothetical protein
MPSGPRPYIISGHAAPHAWLRSLDAAAGSAEEDFGSSCRLKWQTDVVHALTRCAGAASMTRRRWLDQDGPPSQSVWALVACRDGRAELAVPPTSDRTPLFALRNAPGM